MQKIKKILLALTVFILFLFFVTMAHAQISGQCAEVGMSPDGMLFSG